MIGKIEALLDDGVDVGWPALALPCGAAEGGLPASVQLVGRPGADALVLAVGALLEQALASATT